MVVFLASLSEINNNSVSSTMKLRSFVFAAAALVFYFIVCMVFFAHWIVHGRQITLSESLLRDFYSGTKDTMLGRSFNLQFLFRRLLFCLLLTVFYSQSMTVKFSVLIGLQGVYLVALCAIRPFSTVKDNCLEIVNEVGYFVLCGLVAYYNTSSRWSTMIEWVYWSVFVAVICAFFILSLIFMIVAIVNRDKSQIITISSANSVLPVNNKNQSNSVHLQSLENSAESDKIKGTDRGGDSKYQAESYFEMARKKYLGDSKDMPREKSNPYFKKYPIHRESKAKV